MEIFKDLLCVCVSFCLLCLAVTMLFSALESYQRMKIENARYKKELRNLR